MRSFFHLDYSLKLIWVGEGNKKWHVYLKILCASSRIEPQWGGKTPEREWWWPWADGALEGTQSSTTPHVTGAADWCHVSGNTEVAEAQTVSWISCNSARDRVTWIIPLQRERHWCRRGKAESQEARWRVRATQSDPRDWPPKTRGEWGTLGGTDSDIETWCSRGGGASVVSPLGLSLQCLSFNS